MTSDTQEAVLILQDGTIFKGKALGKKGTTLGEICFNTAMTGSNEIYTDPTNFGKILVHAVAHTGIGGYSSQSKNESKGVKINGVVMNHFEKDYFPKETADQTLNQYLKDNEVVGIYEVDTRQLVRHIRENGEMKCIISSESSDTASLKENLSNYKPVSGHDLHQTVSTEKTYYMGDQDSSKKIAVIDLGVKQSVLDQLLNRDSFVAVYNLNTPVEEIINSDANGYLISSGPGNPNEMDYAQKIVKTLLNTGKPLFAIGLGHNLLGAVSGIKNDALFHGRRGLNYPVKNLKTGGSEITAQNTKFTLNAVQANAHPEIEVTHINLNDRSVEGIKIKGKPAFSVQFNPEGNPGPNDSLHLFDEFLALIK